MFASGGYLISESDGGRTLLDLALVRPTGPTEVDHAMITIIADDYFHINRALENNAFHV